MKENSELEVRVLRRHSSSSAPFSKRLNGVKMITGKGVRLRSLERKDLPIFVEWLNDPEVRENITRYSPLSMVEEEEWFNELMIRPVEEHPLAIEINLDNIWITIGNISFLNFDQHNRSAELGIFIGEKRYWGKGYGGDAVCLLLRYGFMNLNLHRIYLRVNENNLRGINCYKKSGFIMEGRARKAQFLNGRYVDLCLMSILNDEWQDREI